MQGGSVRLLLSPMDPRLAPCHAITPNTATPNTVESGLPVRPDVVAHVRSELEWDLFSSPSYLPRLQMASDASGSWGCGAWYGHSWFQLQWDNRSAHLPIMVKELLPIFMAWGPTWSFASATIRLSWHVHAPARAEWPMLCTCYIYWPL